MVQKKKTKLHPDFDYLFCNLRLLNFAHWPFCVLFSHLKKQPVWIQTLLMHDLMWYAVSSTIFSGNLLTYLTLWSHFNASWFSQILFIVLRTWCYLHLRWYYFDSTSEAAKARRPKRVESLNILAPAQANYWFVKQGEKPLKDTNPQEADR